MQLFQTQPISRKFAGSIPDAVIGMFHWVNNDDRTMNPAVDSESNRNECQEYYLGDKAADSQG
jgi:hypothetical protein